MHEVIRRFIENPLVKWYFDPDDMKKWKKLREKYPYLLWIEIMNIRDKKAWRKWAKNYLPNIDHEPRIPNSEKEFVEIQTARRNLYFNAARSFTEPSEPFCREIYTKELFDELKNSLDTFIVDNRVNEAFRLLEQFHEKFSSLDFKKFVQTMKDEHFTIFNDAFLPYIADYESIYRSEKQIMGDTIDEVKAFYRAIGFEVSRAYGNDPPDESKIELEFMYRLCELELNAWREKEFEAARNYLLFQKDFLYWHLIQWIPLLCDDVFNPEFKVFLGGKFFRGAEYIEKYRREITETDFFRAMALITKVLVEHDVNQVKAMIDSLENLDMEKIAEEAKKVEPKNIENEIFYLIPKYEVAKSK